MTGQKEKHKSGQEGITRITTGVYPPMAAAVGIPFVGKSFYSSVEI